MEVAAGKNHLDEAVGFLEKANADLEPELLTVPEARERLRLYAQVRRLADFGVAALAAKVESASEVARVTGTSMGRAKDTVATGKVLGSGELSTALKHGAVSLDQACEIAKAEESSPGAAADLLTVARKEAFHVLRDKARKAKLEAEQHRDLARRQRHARSARSYSDDLGMVHIHMALEPAVGTPLVARAEAQAQRLSRAAGVHKEPFERYLADAYAEMLASDGSVKGPGTRPEMVVVVSHEVAARRWTEVRAGEHCKIPGVGPIDPQEAKAIATRAFINAVICDGKDLREFKRWSRHIPVEIQVALELGDPPDFDGVRCVDCGNRFRTQFDHVEPVAAGGPTSNPNFKPRCWPCHQAKTAADRKAGKLDPKRSRSGPQPERQRPRPRRRSQGIDNNRTSRSAGRDPQLRPGATSARRLSQLRATSAGGDPEAEGVAGGVDIDAHVFLGLVFGQRRSAGFGVGPGSSEVVHLDVEMHLHHRLARSGGPYRWRVVRLGLEGDPDRTVGRDQLHPVLFLGGDLPPQEPPVEICQGPDVRGVQVDRRQAQ